MIVSRICGCTFLACVALLGLGCEVGDAVPSYQRVVLIEARGASWEGLQHQIASGGVASDGPLARMVREGIAAPLRPISAAETFPAMATLESGAWPGTHGIVANRYQRPEDPPGQVTAAYSQARPAVETLWEAAERHGLDVTRIGTLLPHGFRTDPGHARTLPQAEALSRPIVVELNAAPDWRAGLPDGEPSSVPLKLVTDAEVIEVVTGDGIDDRLRLWPRVRDDDGDGRFDTFVLDNDQDTTNGESLAWGDGWARLSLKPGPPAVGAWLYLLDFDPTQPRARLYVRAPHRNRGSPESFVASIESTLSFPPGAPSYGLMAAGAIPSELVLDEIDREVRHVLDATLWTLNSDAPPELMIVDDPIFDRLGHPFWLVDERQAMPQGLAADSQDWSQLVADAYRRLDEHLAEIERGLPADTALMVVSSYAFAAAHTRVGLPKLMSSLGIEIGDSTGVRAVTSTLTTNLYLDDAVDDVEIATALEAARDPRSDEPIFDLVLTRDRLDEVGMAHPNAGDVWARVRPGYTLAGAADAPLLGTPRFPGEHGYRPEDPASQGVFLLRSTGRSASLNSLNGIRAIDVAVTAAGLLGIEPPPSSDGKDVLAPF